MINTLLKKTKIKNNQAIITDTYLLLLHLLEELQNFARFVTCGQYMGIDTL